MSRRKAHDGVIGVDGRDLGLSRFDAQLSDSSGCSLRKPQSGGVKAAPHRQGGRVCCSGAVRRAANGVSPAVST